MSMDIKKTFKYRIYPTSSQETVLEKTLEECRWLYNHCLNERKTAYEKTKKSPSAYDQIKSIAVLKKTRPSLETVHSQVSQNIPIRIDLAFQAFFRRCKAGEKPGYPRFRGQGQYHSFTYPQAGSAFNIIGSNRIKLSKIGNIKIKYHRKIKGAPKTCTVSKTQTGKWFVCISCACVPEKKLKPNKLKVGIDMGLKTFAVLSDGNKIDNPRFFKQEEKALAKAQRKKDKLKKGTRERRKAGRVIPKIYERISNKRIDFLRKEVNNLVRKYGVICVEDLSINDMMESGKKKHLSKSIGDAAWGLFLSFLSFKAENAGRVFVKVNPAYTTQDCSSCGTRRALRMDERVYECGVCGLSMDRDLNAARNILGVGLHTLRTSKEAS
jgi:putative transposase